MRIYRTLNLRPQVSLLSGMLGERGFCQHYPPHLSCSTACASSWEESTSSQYFQTPMPSETAVACGPLFCVRGMVDLCRLTRSFHEEKFPPQRRQF